MARVALIPPYSLLPSTYHRSLHMLLPACVEAYASLHYAAVPGTHIILDNGLFEDGKPLSAGKLLQLGALLKADEVVLPDVRNDRILTCEAVAHFLKAYRAQEDFRCTFMAVVQGENYLDRCTTVRMLADIVPPGTVLGFPRRLTQESTQERIKLMEYAIATNGRKFQLHMLGMSREWPGELLRAARQFGSHLRGIDTSAPYIYAYYDEVLRAQWEDKSERPDEYFYQPDTAFPAELTEYNIHVLDSWISSNLPLPFTLWKKQQVTD